jgi:tetratricopeptide (TPR) repeat protein
MKIRELPSQDMETPTNEAMKRAEELVHEIEEASPMSLSSESVKKLRNVFLESFVQAEFSEEQRVNAWRLSYRLWNTSVDIVNNLEMDQELTEDHAELRQIASDFLAIAGAIGNARSCLVRIAMFFFKTGCTWHKIKKYLKASVCFEKAFELCFKQEGSTSQSSDTREQNEFFFSLFLGRARTAWELGGQTLAFSLLGRARDLLPTIPADRHAELAEQYLQFGKSLLWKDDSDLQAESIRYMETGLDICSEALSTSQLHDVNKTNLDRLKQRLWRYLAAGHLQNENYESALRCVDALRLTMDHVSTSYFALRALAKLGRHDELELELFTLVDHAGIQVDVYVSALEIVIQECSRIDAVEKAFFILLGQFGPNREQLPAKVLEKLLRQELSGDPSCIKRVELALKIACDENILTALTAENEGLVLEDRRHQRAQKQRQFVHALLWTR